MQRKGVVMLSAGIDSTAMAIKLLSDGWALRGIFVDNGQYCAARQRTAIMNLSRQYNMPVDFWVTNLAQLYAGLSEPPHIMVSEPFLPVDCTPASSASSGGTLVTCGLYAANTGCSHLFYGLTKDEMARLYHFPGVITLAEQLVRANTGRQKFIIECPWSKTTNAKVLQNLLKLDKNATTWSCDWGGPKHCGTCRGCVTRQARFHTLKMPDPTVYEDRV